MMATMSMLRGVVAVAAVATGTATAKDAEATEGQGLFVGVIMGDSADVPNMNGEYPGIANPNPNKPFPQKHRGKYFEVYGHPITNQYSQVFWTKQPPVRLPEEIIEQFNGRPIAFTGFEEDIVRMLPNGSYVSVPRYEWYNHHYCVTIQGHQSELVYVGRRTKTEGVARHAIERNPPEWEPRAANDPTPSSKIPTAQNFWQGNGGESRRSFKHYPKGYGQLIESPTNFILQPMLINTNGHGGGESLHVSGPIPQTAYGSEPNQTIDRSYSPLMECPCTTRVRRSYSGFTTTLENTCANLTITSAEMCFSAIQELTGSMGHGGGVVTTNVTAADPTAPSGCFMILHTSGGTESIEAHYNPARTETVCGETDGRPPRSVGSNAAGMFVELDLDARTGNATITLAGPVGVWFGVGFNAVQMKDMPYTITVEADGTVTERQLANHDAGSVLPQSVELVSSNVTTNPPEIENANHFGSPYVGVASVRWQDCEDSCNRNATCVAWTFNPVHFSTPYNIADGTCYLRFGLGDGQGDSGFTMKEYVSGMVSGQNSQGQTLTVVLRRALKGQTAAHYSFDPTQSTLNYIEAVGTTPDYQYHGKARAGHTLMMVEAGSPLCVCKAAHIGGSINGVPFRDDCMQYPLTTISRDHNPTCEVDTYMGGMLCCMHEVILLDADQQVPAKTDTIQMKWRFYYEDPNVTNTENAFFVFFETEANHGEYDVPKCKAGTAPENCVHTITARRTLDTVVRTCADRADVWCTPGLAGVEAMSEAAPPNGAQYLKFVHISPHCHGPSCISMELIDTAQNETICKTHPVYGTGDEVMDEAGYATGILPCIWGTEEEGLNPPPVVPVSAEVFAIKKVNSTIKHTGVMAHWQMRAVWATEKEFREYRSYMDAKKVAH